MGKGNGSTRASTSGSPRGISQNTTGVGRIATQKEQDIDAISRIVEQMEKGDFSGYGDIMNRVKESYSKYYNVPQIPRESALFELAYKPVKLGNNYYTVSRSTGVMGGRITQVMNRNGRFIRTESTMQRVEKALLEMFRDKLKELRK